MNIKDNPERKVATSQGEASLTASPRGTRPMTKEDSQQVSVNWTHGKPSPLWHRLWARLLINKKGAAADQAPPGNTITSVAEESNPDESGQH